MSTSLMGTLILASIAVYILFLFIQTRSHTQIFIDTDNKNEFH
jgi:Ca2+:H+ antiporter